MEASFVGAAYSPFPTEEGLSRECTFICHFHSHLLQVCFEDPNLNQGEGGNSKNVTGRREGMGGDIAQSCVM
jgi:hypothetical protein